MPVLITIRQWARLFPVLTLMPTLITVALLLHLPVAAAARPVCCFPYSPYLPYPLFSGAAEKQLPEINLPEISLPEICL